MRPKILIAALAVILAGACPSAAGVYSVNFQEGTIKVTGSIRTDDVIGPLTIGDIFTYDLSAAAPGIAIENLTPQDSLLEITGNDLVSTGTQLTFAYGADDGGIFRVFEHFVEPFPQLCNGTAGQDTCGQGVTVSDPSDQAFAPVTGTVVIAETPEPAIWAMLLIGFAGLAAMGWRRRQGGPLSTRKAQRKSGCTAQDACRARAPCSPISLP
jgi:hypothetical protein